MTHALYIENDDGTEREVTDTTERAAVMAELVAGTRLSDVRSAGRASTKRVVYSAARQTAHVQDEADRAAAQAEVRSRTFQVFRRSAPGHPKTPAETPEIVTFGDPGDVFDAADIAQFRVDYGADRIVSLP